MSDVTTITKWTIVSVTLKHGHFLQLFTVSPFLKVSSGNDVLKCEHAMCAFNSVVLPIFVLNSLLATWTFPMWSHIYGFWVIHSHSWGKGPTGYLNPVPVLFVYKFDLRKGLTAVSTCVNILHTIHLSIQWSSNYTFMNYVLSSCKGAFWVWVTSQREFFLGGGLVFACIIKYANNRVHLKFSLLVLKNFINYGISHIE